MILEIVTHFVLGFGVGTFLFFSLHKGGSFEIIVAVLTVWFWLVKILLV